MNIDKDNRAKAIIAQVAKKQIEQKYGSVANAITQLCSQQPDQAVKQQEQEDA